jgi:hypothetical protein
MASHSAQSEKLKYFYNNLMENPELNRAPEQQMMNMHYQAVSHNLDGVMQHRKMKQEGKVVKREKMRKRVMD